jgi:hypothetical protein
MYLSNLGATVAPNTILTIIKATKAYKKPDASYESTSLPVGSSYIVSSIEAVPVGGSNLGATTKDWYKIAITGKAGLWYVDVDEVGRGNIKVEVKQVPKVDPRLPTTTGGTPKPVVKPPVYVKPQINIPTYAPTPQLYVSAPVKKTNWWIIGGTTAVAAIITTIILTRPKHRGARR